MSNEATYTRKQIEEWGRQKGGAVRDVAEQMLRDLGAEQARDAEAERIKKFARYIVADSCYANVLQLLKELLTPYQLRAAEPQKPQQVSCDVTAEELARVALAAIHCGGLQWEADNVADALRPHLRTRKVKAEICNLDEPKACTWRLIDLEMCGGTYYTREAARTELEKMMELAGATVDWQEGR